MIGRLRGELLELGGTTATVDCGGVGYEVSLPESVLLQLPAPGGRVDLFVRQVFREDGTALYGFLDAFQRLLFDLLTEVKGCGPKIALSVIGALGEHAVVGAIVAGDARALARAPGVGARLAERILLELKDKAAEEAAHHRIAAEVDGRPGPHAPPDELVEALIALGYRRIEAESAARGVDGDGTVEDRLKLALRSLTR